MSHFKAKIHQILFPAYVVRPPVCFRHGQRDAATSTRRDGGDRGGRCLCWGPASLPPSVRSFVRAKRHLRLKTHGAENRRRFSELKIGVVFAWQIPKVGSGFRLWKSAPVFDPVCLQPKRRTDERTNGHSIRPSFRWSSLLVVGLWSRY